MREQAKALFNDTKVDRRCPGCGITIVASCVHDAFCFDCKPEVLHVAAYADEPEVAK